MPSPFASHVVGIVVSAVLFSVLSRVLPDAVLWWRDVMVGALVTSARFAVGQRVIGLYLGQAAFATSFGAAGTVAIILVWVYYAAQIILPRAVFTDVFANSRTNVIPLMLGIVPTNDARA